VKQRIAEILLNYRKRKITRENLKSSAVLVPLFCNEGQCHVLFTQRSNEVKFHKGQVCFPGGTFQPGDTSLLQTALREAEEEIGLKAEDVEILGELDDTITVTSGYVISPFVAFIPHPYLFKVNCREIKQILSVPLTTLMDEANFRRGWNLQTNENQAIPAYHYEYKGHNIWGATARILKHFIELLLSESGALC
jgi:8-oxo-dGTP pyrophosphatase MutT (NUDIX family)